MAEAEVVMRIDERDRVHVTTRSASARRDAPQEDPIPTARRVATSAKDMWVDPTVEVRQNASWGRRSALLCCVVLALWSSAPAWAQTSCADEAACIQQAGLLADRAGERFRAEDFDAAVVLLREAIALHETAALHHNLGLTLMELERWDEARAAFHTCLTLNPPPATRARIERDLARIELELAPPEPIEPPDEDTAFAPPPAPRPPPGSPDPLGPALLMGAGGAIALGAIPFGVLFQNEVDTVRNAPSHREAPPPDDADLFAVLTNVFWIAGSAVLLGGLVWWIVQLTEGTPSPSEHAELRF
ncbi:MAG: tetratricopeptide repeat protein [Sandaracinaceae bacterium]